jgi:hypothetical protein
MKTEAPKSKKSKISSSTSKKEMQEVMKALGLDQLGLENEVDLDKMLELS